eukprot:COSAG01_NODE_10251_length_2209_cov_8.560190_1_plen_90_part_10
MPLAVEESVAPAPRQPSWPDGLQRWCGWRQAHGCGGAFLFCGGGCFLYSESKMNHLFGKKKEPAPKPGVTEAATKMKAHLATMEKREKFI